MRHGKKSQEDIFAGRYFREKIFSREDIFAGRYFRVDSIFAKIFQIPISRIILPAKIKCYTVYEIIYTAFHEAMILCFRILLTKDFDVIKKDAIYDGA